MRQGSTGQLFTAITGTNTNWRNFCADVFFRNLKNVCRERFGDALPDEAALERFSQSIQLFYRDFYEEGDALLALFSIHEEEIHLYDDMCHCLKNAFFAYYIESKTGNRTGDGLLFVAVRVFL